MANADTNSPAVSSATSAAFALGIADSAAIITVTDLGPEPKLAPAGRTKRTMAEIKAQAAAKCAAKEAERVQKALARAAKKLADMKAKELRAQARRARSEAALEKRIAAERKRRNRKQKAMEQKNGVSRTIHLKPETPRHVNIERLRDDPNKVAYNHVVDESSIGIEDELIAVMDGDLNAKRVTSPLSQPTLEETLIEKVLAGTADLADLVALIALDGTESVAQVVSRLLPAKVEKELKGEIERVHSKDVEFEHRLRAVKAEGRKDHGKRKGWRKLIRKHNRRNRKARLLARIAKNAAAL